MVEESSSMVLPLLKREGVGAQSQALSERVRKLSDRALQIGLECSRHATHKWLSQALKGGAGPAHRWCRKEDALSELPLVIRDSQGNFTAGPRSVWRNVSPTNGNVSGAAKTLSVSTRR